MPVEMDIVVLLFIHLFLFFFSSRRRHTRLQGDWSSNVCSSDLDTIAQRPERRDACSTITATVRAPLWQAGDVLVVDPRASDGGGSRALIRVDATTDRKSVV